MKFVADKMLGRLAKWLRVIGQDVTYGPHLSGYGLIRAARREERLILTRNRNIAQKHPPDYILIRSDRFREQLKEVVEACRIDPFERPFSRCIECNSLLQPISKDSVREKVPPYVFSTQESFSLCPKCRRIYWPATHQQKMLEELKNLNLG
jgi:uncharacterized protein with PIN domain